MSRPAGAHSVARDIVLKEEHVWTADKLAKARIKRAGTWIGWDGKSNKLLMFEIDGAPRLFGQYTIEWATNQNDYNIRFGVFAYLKPEYFGNPDITKRERFTIEESHSQLCN